MRLTLTLVALVLTIASSSAYSEQRPSRSFPNATITASPAFRTPLANGSCPGGCTRAYGIDGMLDVNYGAFSSYYWAPLKLTATVTAATVVHIVNAKNHSTRTTTIFNKSLNTTDIPLPGPTETNEAGTRTTHVTLNGRSGQSTGVKVLTFPTGFFEYPSTYAAWGNIPTRVSGTPTCLSVPHRPANPEFFTFPSHPVLPTETDFSAPNSINGTREDALARVALDPKGWTFNYKAYIKCDYGEIVSTLMPGVGAWQCQPLGNCQAGEEVAQAALFLTQTSTSTEGNGDDGGATQGSQADKTPSTSDTPVSTTDSSTAATSTSQPDNETTDTSSPAADSPTATSHSARPKDRPTEAAALQQALETSQAQPQTQLVATSSTDTTPAAQSNSEDSEAAALSKALELSHPQPQPTIKTEAISAQNPSDSQVSQGGQKSPQSSPPEENGAQDSHDSQDSQKSRDSQNSPQSNAPNIPIIPTTSNVTPPLASSVSPETPTAPDESTIDTHPTAVFPVPINDTEETGSTISISPDSTSSDNTSPESNSPVGNSSDSDSRDSTSPKDTGSDNTNPDKTSPDSTSSENISPDDTSPDNTSTAAASISTILTTTDAAGSPVLKTTHLPATILTSTNAAGSQIITTLALPSTPLSTTTSHILPPIILNSHTITPNLASAYMISSQTLAPGSPITLSGKSGSSATVVALQTNSGTTALVVGSSTSVLPSATTSERPLGSEIMNGFGGNNSSVGVSGTSALPLTGGAGRERGLGGRWMSVFAGLGVVVGGVVV